MFEGIDETLAGEPYMGEYFLTDALQYMIDNGARINVLEVEGWYDCGKPETLIETNRHLLETGRALRPEQVGDNEVIDPVRIEPGAELSAVKIGPNVTIEKGARIRSSVLSNCIVGNGSVLEACALRDSLIGSHVEARGLRGRALLGDHAVIEGREG